MENNISDLLSKEIEKLMANKFFFRMPSNLKILSYSASYLVLILLGTLLNIEIIAAFLSVFPLTYVLGARGLKLFLPLIVSGGVMLSVLASPVMMFWFGIHMVVAYIIYKTISSFRELFEYAKNISSNIIHNVICIQFMFSTIYTFFIG